MMLKLRWSTCLIEHWTHPVVVCDSLFILEISCSQWDLSHCFLQHARATCDVCTLFVTFVHFSRPTSIFKNYFM